MSTFITNSGEKSLKKRLQELIEKSEELKFLVGFFYFSGVRELYESLKRLDENGKLKEGHLKILVGLDIDEGVWGIYETAIINEIYNKNRLKEKFFNSLKIAFNSEELDNKETYEQIKFFIKLLKEGKLVLRKTKDPNHAKLYLFKMDESIKSVIPNLFITGSSNLTKFGLESQDEFNVEVKDYGFEEAEKYFDELWEKGIELSQEDINKTIYILENKSFLKEISPFEAYAYLLKTYLELHKGKILRKELEDLLKEKGYKPYNYQMEAVAQALANCESHGGTLLADVVGLGKTIVACLVGKALGKRGIVICPPHLMGDDNKTSGWKKYLEDFKLFDWEVRSLGKLEETLEFVKDREDIQIVIVDEAHRFRNENTQSYQFLKEICRGKTVILITATPFNNEPSDLFSLLKLFTVPKKSTIILDEDLENRFDYYQSIFYKLAYIKNYWNSKDNRRKRRAQRYYRDIFGENEIDLSKVKNLTKLLAREIRATLEPVVIRRNRLDLKYYGEKIELPEVKDPKECFFELTQEESKFYDEVITTFAPLEDGGTFTGAIYFPARYEKVEQLGLWEEMNERSLTKEEQFLYIYQRNLYDFMRRLLVKRFESSFGAFRESILRFRDVHKTALEFVKKTRKFILDRKLMDDLVTADPDEILEELKKYEEELKKENINNKYYKIYDIDKFEYREEFIKDIEKDLTLFDRLIEKIDNLKLLEKDPKAEKLIEEIKTYINEGRKVVIFTEYLDTAKYLERILEKEFKDILLSAYGNFSRKTIEDIYKNFDAQYKDQEDKYKILLTTDKLSEGFNLNRAGVVINYDIPWNPVRVIQRVGRINRIAKKVYDEIYILNFFPTEQGADIVKSREIAQTKMFMIHNVLGEDAKIFDPDEEPQPAELYKRLNTYYEEEEESFFTRVRRDFELIEKNYPEIIEEIKDMPKRVKISKKGKENELLVFIKKGKDLFVGYKNYEEKQPKSVTFEEVYEKIIAQKEEKALPLSDNFWTNYNLILDQTAYKKYSTSRGQSIKEKAYNMLNFLLQEEDEEKRIKIKPYEKFISNLIEDIRSFGTLSEYTLNQIADLENKELDKIIEELEKLKKLIGEDFLDKVLENIKSHKEEIIIAIENRIMEEGTQNA
ncbi:helicase-related protein [Dictyoglomus thermophilum]|uniref:Type III restriction enzyme, res subunit family n=1 Tax=Dictyoglomus thermophilum (strain ATCC 35947 / DSM 3960 / H-6-12) TaxID=309799 RepID=B5YB61_DICT6|nr:helicase-related protein [Dictyoglomus thermophilum]ACI19140.1 type III restriction enzyme, res subunit family [Dictyoglomus thermophilum H-6-12]